MAATESDVTLTGGKSNRAARVVIVDDHELLRDGMIELMANDPKLQVCGEASGEGLREPRQDVEVV